MNVGTGGTFTYASATVFNLNTSTSDGNITSLNLIGGTFTTGAAIRNNTNALSALNTAFAHVTLNDGGTLKISADIPQLLTNNVGNIRLLLGETGTGGIIDTNGFSTAIDKPIGNVTGQAGKLTKQGAGTLTLSGGTAYTGATTITGGTLSLGASEVLPDSSAIVLGGGNLLTGTGQIETALSLNLTAPSIITMGGTGGTSILTFTSGTAGSSGISATSPLSIYNWNGLPAGGGDDRLIVPAASLNASELANISFYSDNGTTLFAGASGATFAAGGEIVPVPEPTVTGSALLVLAFSLRRRR